MIRSTVMIATATLLLACGQDTPELEQPANSDKNHASKTSSLRAILGEQQYEVDAHCQYLDKTYFQFRSDKTDMSDSDGDGIAISGMEHGGKFVLTIIDNGKTYSTPRLENFTKDSGGASGSGALWEDNGSGVLNAEFTVICASN